MNLVIDSKFRPFTFDEMVKPLILYKQEYDKVEKDYSDLAAQTEMWKDIANREKNPIAYEMYQRYSNDLAAYTDSFSKGMNLNNRSGLLGMKRRYSQDIAPIDTAYKRQQALADEQRVARAKDPTIRYERYANNMSLDDFIEDPTADYGRSYSGALLTKQVSDAAANFKKQISEVGNLTKMGLPFQYQQMIRQGFSPDAVFKAMADDAQAGNDQAVKYLRGIVDNVMTASGVANWADDETLREFRNFANQGLYSAIGETELKHYTDSYSAQEAHEINRERRAADRDIPVGDNRLYYRQVPKTTVQDMDRTTTQMKEDLALLTDIMRDPTLINKSSTRTVEDPIMISPDPQMSFVMSAGTRPGSGRTETYYPYQEKLKELSKRYGDIKYTITDGKLSDHNFAEIASTIDNNIRSSAVRSFAYKPNITQSDLITQVIKEDVRSYSRRSGETGLHEIMDNKKGSAVKVEDINKYFTSDADIDFDPDLGFVINATDKEGKTRSAVIDIELIDTPNRAFASAKESLQDALNSADGTTIINTEYGKKVVTSQELIGYIMKAFYDKYNTLEKKESNTFSK